MDKTILTSQQYLKITIPLILTSAVQPLLGAFNTALMGQMPEAAYIAAVAMGVIFLNNVYWLFGFLRVATTTFSSQALGRKSSPATAFALLRPLVLAILLGMAFWLAYPWLLSGYEGLMGIQSYEQQLLDSYLAVAIYSAPLVLANYVIVGWLMGQMLIRATMIMQISMNLLNIVLAGYFIIYAQAGITGLALALVIAQVYGGVVGLLLVIRSQRLELANIKLGALLAWGEFKPLLAMQRDLMLRTVCLLTINNVFARAGNEMGVDYMAANAILLELIFVISFVYDGMANGLSVFVGKSFGQGDIQAIRTNINVAFKSMLVFGVSIAVVVLFFGSSLVTIMTDQSSLLIIATDYTIYLALHALLAGPGLLLYGVYTAIGYTSYIRNMMILAALLFCSLITMALPQIGNDGIWLGYVVTYAFESLAYYQGLKYLLRYAEVKKVLTI